MVSSAVRKMASAVVKEALRKVRFWRPHPHSSACRCAGVPLAGPYLLLI